VPALVQRLAVEGYALPAAPAAPAAAANSATNAAAGPAAANDPTLYSTQLAAVVADFQNHHALDATGVLDAPTVAALNVSAQERLNAIDVNLERARWLPLDLPTQRIEADIAGPDVTLFVDSKPALSMRAVAGAPHRETPIFASAVDSVEFNPPWYVPADIARRELLPKGAAYLSRNGFVVNGGSVMQRAGPQSALGFVKFNISDPFAVYLHDTPSRGAFASDMRWRSHGCMRLQEPRQLAAALLGPQGWTPVSIDQAIAAKATRTIPLKVKTPVYLIYRTADAGDDGKVTFRADVYHWDAELSAAMSGHPLAPHHTATTAGA
jgi:murein L,D-transpeptidase YcbB/YkuD